MIDLGAIATRLRADVPVLVETGTARDLGRLSGDMLRFPAAYAVPLAEGASENRYANAQIVDQRVMARFGVIIAARDIGRSRGEPALDDLRAVRGAILSSLAGYVPPGADSPCVPRQGRLVSGVDRSGGMFWQDDYEVAFNRRLPS